MFFAIRYCHTDIPTQLSSQDIIIRCVGSHLCYGCFVYTKINQKTSGDVTVVAWAIQILRATEAQEHPTLVVKLIALGMPAKVVVIIKNQDACFRTYFFQAVPGSRKSAHARADNDQIIVFLQ